MERSYYGSELVAGRIGTEIVMALSYRLIFFGITINGPSHVYDDNISVINKWYIPYSIPEKNKNSIDYHKLREALAEVFIWL